MKLEKLGDFSKLNVRIKTIENDTIFYLDKSIDDVKKDLNKEILENKTEIAFKYIDL